jgi:hypothetical protein
MQNILSLHCNPSESRMVARISFRAECAESAEKQQEERKIRSEFISSLRPLRLCAHIFLSAGSWFGPARSAKPCNVALGTRCFEQEKTERTKRHWTWYISPFPLLPPVRIVCMVATGRAVFLFFCGQFIFGCGSALLGLCAEQFLPGGFWMGAVMLPASWNLVRKTA